MHKHRLGLIVGVVGHGNRSRADSASYPSQKSVSPAPGGLFRGEFVTTGRFKYIRRLCRSREAPIASQLGDKSGVGIGIRATHLVIEMGNMQIQG
jgi:hypothetical protein